MTKPLQPWPLTEEAKELLPQKEAGLREQFEALARDSYGFRRSRKGSYMNPAVARDWKWFQLGALVRDEMRFPGDSCGGLTECDMHDDESN